MHKFISSRKLVLFAVIAAALYAVLALLLPERFLMELFNGVFLGVVGAVSVVFFPLAIRAIRNKTFDRVSQLVVGIILTWFSLIGSRALSVLINATGEATRIAASPIIGLLAYMAILGGVLHVTAPGMVENEWKYNKGLLACGLFVGFIVAGIAIFVQRNGLPA